MLFRLTFRQSRLRMKSANKTEAAPKFQVKGAGSPSVAVPSAMITHDMA